MNFWYIIPSYMQPLHLLLQHYVRSWCFRNTMELLHFLNQKSAQETNCIAQAEPTGEVSKDLHFRPSQSLSRAFLLKYLFKTQKTSLLLQWQKSNWEKWKCLGIFCFWKSVSFLVFCVALLSQLWSCLEDGISHWCELKAILWTNDTKTFVLDTQKWQIQPDMQTLGAVPRCWKQRRAGSTQRCPTDRNLQNQLQPGSSYTAQKK